MPKRPSYIKDIAYSLRKIDDHKELPPGSLVVTLDDTSLYTNMPHKEGIKACIKVLNSSGHLSRSRLKTESICDLMRMILTMNNFEFSNNHFIKLHGTAMGRHMAPAYPNLFMSDLEEQLLAQFPLKLYLWCRYIDHIFMDSWRRQTRRFYQPHKLITNLHMNFLNPTFHFLMSRYCLTTIRYIRTC